MSLKQRITHGWNAFMNKDPTPISYRGDTYSVPPDRVKFRRINDKSIVTSVFTRIAMDCALCDVKHVELDDRGRYKQDVDSTLNECLSFSANIDQTGRAMLMDVVLTMFGEGVVAIVPTHTNIDPDIEDSYEIEELRVGRITEFMAHDVRIDLYNEDKARHEEVVLPKDIVAIVENPMYPVINEHNSTAQRLMRKIAILDAIDERSASGRLDLIITLPYSTKTETKRQQAEGRRADIENQLTNSKYGVAYLDPTEHVTQLNRAVENQLPSQIDSLTRMLLSQLNMTEEILNGTADEKVMTNYLNRTVGLIMLMIVEEMRRKFLTDTARKEKRQTITFFRDPFKLIPATELASMADSLTRNAILTSNEIREKIGLRPAENPEADELRNKNLNPSKDEQHIDIDGNDITKEVMANQAKE